MLIGYHINFLSFATPWLVGISYIGNSKKEIIIFMKFGNYLQALGGSFSV